MKLERKLSVTRLCFSLFLLVLSIYIYYIYVSYNVHYNYVIKDYQHLDMELKQKRFPNCIIIGVKKCGTGALSRYLRYHPRVAMPSGEIHFFDEPDTYNLGLDWYREQMVESDADQITIEKTPAYYITPNVSDKIYDMSKNMRVIIIVREPITRLLGDYLHIKRERVSNDTKFPSFNEMITTTNGSVNTSSIIVKVSRYVDSIDNWIDKFSLQNIHVVDGERLIVDPYSEIVLIEKFLSLKRFYRRDHFVYNAKKGYFCFKLDSTRSDNCLSASKGVEHPPIDKRIVNMFTKYFKPYTEKFFKKIKKNFDWKMALEKINTK